MSHVLAMCKLDFIAFVITCSNHQYLDTCFTISNYGPVQEMVY